MLGTGGLDFRRLPEAVTLAEEQPRTIQAQDARRLGAEFGEELLVLSSSGMR